MMTANAMLPIVAAESKSETRWFSAHGCVVERDARMDVFLGGTLVGSFAADDTTMRNMIIVGLCGDGRIRFRRLARAFQLSVEQVRRIRLQYERGGAEAIMRRHGGRQRKATAALRRRLFGLFDGGLTVSGAHMALRKRVSRAVVGRVRKEWAKERGMESSSEPSEASDAAHVQ